MFSAVDPNTGEPPDDPFAGFLPPFNEETQFELGWVEYTIEPHKDLQTGDQIENVAFVQFDFVGPFNPAPKDENGDPKPWLDTIDAGAPTSEVAVLPPRSGRNFRVKWSGTDDGGGSGIGCYRIFVAKNDGAFAIWLDETTETSAEFTGTPGSEYAFYAVSKDNVSNFELQSIEAEAATAIAEFPRWNADNPFDTNGVDFVSPIDALLVINELNQTGGYSTQNSTVEALFFDPSKDKFVSPIDALMVNN